MTDDDGLDPVLAERFRALDDVIPPDTWPGASIASSSHRRRWLPVTAAAALVILVVAAVAFVRTDREDDSIVGGPATPAPSTAPSPVTTFPSAPATIYVVESALATAESSVAVPGQLVVITPPEAVERMCANVVDVYSSADDVLIGQISGGRAWSPVVGGGPPPTWPACGGETTDAPFTVAVPPVADGTYRFCLVVGAAPEGCAVVTVVATGGQSIEPTGTATPASAVPGQLVSVAPAQPVLRACTDVVSVYSGTTYLGYVGGSRFRPSPGEGDTLAACEGDVSDAPIEVFVPRLTPGRYVFCASDDLLPEGCANVDVLPSPLLATVSPTEVSTGDVITITPAGVIDRICTGWVRVFDATRATPVRELIDLASGASQEPAFGGWEAPDCEPEPSDDPVTMVVPDLLLGAYAFCLSADLDDGSCALVSVTAQRFAEPTVPLGSTAPVGQPFEIEVGTHCGVRYLSQVIDGRSWITDEAPDVFEWTPDEWADAVDPSRPEQLVLTIVLSADGSELTATANGRSVRYRPVNPDDPEFFCA